MNDRASHRLDDDDARRVRLVGLLTAATAAFAAVGYAPLRWANVSIPVAVILVVAGLAAVAAARARAALQVLAVGGALVLLGLYRLATYGHGSAGIGGSSSTAALLTGLGLSQLGIVAAASLRALAAGRRAAR